MSVHSINLDCSLVSPQGPGVVGTDFLIFESNSKQGQCLRVFRKLCVRMVHRASVTLSELQKWLIDNPLNHLALPSPAVGYTSSIWWSDFPATLWDAEGKGSPRGKQNSGWRGGTRYPRDQSRHAPAADADTPTTCAWQVPHKCHKIIQRQGPGIGSGWGTGSPQPKKIGTSGLHGLGCELGSSTRSISLPKATDKAQETSGWRVHSGYGDV